MRRLLVACAATVGCVASSVAGVGAGGAYAAISSAGGAAASAARGALASPADASGLTTRLAGADRYATAAAIASQYPPGVPVVYIATGLGYPDALAAGAAAGTQSPVLLVAGPSIPAVVAEQVQRLRPGKVILVGGPRAVPDSVGVALGAYATGGWTRLSGADRYATAAAVSAATFSPGVSVVYVATGVNYPDALTGASLGAIHGVPVLLTATNTLPSSTVAELARLQPGSIDILGGEQAVSAAVQQALGSYSASVYRDAGSSRYDTNVAANEEYEGAAPVGGQLIVATGENFPDALSGAALAGHLGADVLLVGPGSLDSQQADFIAGHSPTSLIVLGGVLSVSDAAVTNVLVAAGLEVAPPESHPADYALSYTPGGELLRWNPCRTIGWRLNAPGLPQATVDLITQGIAELSAASGLKFHYDGTTTFVPTQENVSGEPDDIIVAWLPRGSTDLFDNLLGADGVGGIVYRGGTSTPLQIVHGYAYFDAAALPHFDAHIDHALVLHEFGHAVGLLHAEYETEIMYPVATDESPDTYSAGDRAGLAKVGAAAGCVS